MVNIRHRMFSLSTAFMLVLSLFSMLPRGALRAEAAAKTYMLYVKGVQVTSENASDILGGSEASYDNSTRNLTLYKNISTDVDYQQCINNTGVNNLTITAANEVTLTASGTSSQAISCFDANTTVTGKMILNGFDAGLVASDCSVTLKDAEITANGGVGSTIRSDTTVTGSGRISFESTRGETGGIGILIAKDAVLTLDSADVTAYGKSIGIRGGAGSKLIVNNSSLRASAESSSGVGIDGVAGGIELTGCKYIAPAGASVKDGTVYEANNQIKAQMVEIDIQKWQNGDVNHDGTVDRIDANLLSRCVAGWDGYEDRIFKDVSDLNGDGNVDRIDANILSRCVADWDGYRAKYIK